jgi:hypothetical protein
MTEKANITGHLKGATRLSLCGAEGIVIGGQKLMPDARTAYVEMYLSHALPVETSDKTALHPQTVANSYGSMLHKVFDLAHLMKQYTEELPANDPNKARRDWILGTIVAVEFPANISGYTAAEMGQQADGSWRAQGDKDRAPGIRAVAALHKQAERVPEILRTHFRGEMTWTVSMENQYWLENSGFLLREGRWTAGDGWVENTPADLRELGWVYVPYPAAPKSLQKCLDETGDMVTQDWQGIPTLALLGGLNGPIAYQGAAITPLGKEKEALIGRVLASESVPDWPFVPDLPFKPEMQWEQKVIGALEAPLNFEPT